MRSSPFFLVALSQVVSADWFMGQLPERYTGNDPIPRMTAASGPDGVNGWSPKPTEAPVVDDGSDDWDLLKRSDQWLKVKRQQSSTWTNSKTCGWFSRSECKFNFARRDSGKLQLTTDLLPPVEPFTCTASETCTTNTDRVVACETGGATTGFFTMCFDYDAYTKGVCSGMGPKTGCCWTSTIGACITYLWPGATPRSMYRCHTSPTIVTMLDVPRSVLEDSTRTSSLPIITSSSSSSTTTTSSSSTSSGTSTGTTTPDDGGGSSNAGAIAGGVVGGVAGAAVLAGAIIFILIKRRGPKPSAGTPQVNPAYSAVAPADNGYNGGAGGQLSPAGAGYPHQSMSPPPMAQTGYFPPGSPTVVGQPSPSAAYLNPSSNTPPAPYDPRQSYYDPAKLAAEQQGQQPYPGPGSPPNPHYGAAAVYPNTTPSPHNAGGFAAPGQYQGMAAPPPMPGQHGYPPAQFVSELDNTAAVPQGQQGNPVEMPVNSPVQGQQQQQ